MKRILYTQKEWKLRLSPSQAGQQTMKVNNRIFNEFLGLLTAGKRLQFIDLLRYLPLKACLLYISVSQGYFQKKICE
ncbi:MAG: hypothetical protein ACFFDI_05370 [Promethearchaeota archaeon]